MAIPTFFGIPRAGDRIPTGIEPNSTDATATAWQTAHTVLSSDSVRITVARFLKRLRALGLFDKVLGLYLGPDTVTIAQGAQKSVFYPTNVISNFGAGVFTPGQGYGMVTNNWAWNLPNVLSHLSAKYNNSIPAEFTDNYNVAAKGYDLNGGFGFIYKRNPGVGTFPKQLMYLNSFVAINEYDGYLQCNYGANGTTNVPDTAYSSSPFVHVAVQNEPRTDYANFDGTGTRSWIKTNTLCNGKLIGSQNSFYYGTGGSPTNGSTMTMGQSGGATGMHFAAIYHTIGMTIAEHAVWHKLLNALMGSLHTAYTTIPTVLNYANNFNTGTVSTIQFPIKGTTFTNSNGQTHQITTQSSALAFQSSNAAYDDGYGGTAYPYPGTNTMTWYQALNVGDPTHFIEARLVTSTDWAGIGVLASQANRDGLYVYRKHGDANIMRIMPVVANVIGTEVTISATDLAGKLLRVYPNFDTGKLIVKNITDNVTVSDSYDLPSTLINNTGTAMLYGQRSSAHQFVPSIDDLRTGYGDGTV